MGLRPAARHACANRRRAVAFTRIPPALSRRLSAGREADGGQGKAGREAARAVPCKAYWWAHHKQPACSCSSNQLPSTKLPSHSAARHTPTLLPCCGCGMRCAVHAAPCCTCRAVLRTLRIILQTCVASISCCFLPISVSNTFCSAVWGRAKEHVRQHWVRMACRPLCAVVGTLGGH